MDLTATQAVFALVTIVGVEVLALAGRQAGLLSKVGPWRGAALPALACWLGLALGALALWLCFPDYPRSGPPEKLGVLFVTPGLVLGAATLAALARRTQPEPPGGTDGWRVARAHDAMHGAVALAVLFAAVGLPATYRFTTSPAQRALPWSATDVEDTFRWSPDQVFPGRVTARLPEIAAREVAARLGLAPVPARADRLAWGDDRGTLMEWQDGRLEAWGGQREDAVTASKVAFLLVAVLGAFGFGCCGALAVDAAAKRRAFARPVAACWVGLGAGALARSLLVPGPPEAVGLLLVLPGVVVGAAAALVVVRRDVTHARPGALDAHPRAALWCLGAGTAAAPLALLLVYGLFTEGPQRALPWSAREVRDTCSWEAFFPDYSYTLEARLSEEAFLAYVARLGLEPRQEGWTGAGFGGPRQVPSGQVWVFERGEERCEAVWIDGWLHLSASRI